MSGVPSTGPTPEDPFQGLEGLGEDLEETFAALDEKADRAEGSREGQGGGRRQAAAGDPGGRKGDPGDAGSDAGDLGPLGDLGSLLGGLSGLDSLFSEVTRMLRGNSVAGGGILRQVREIGRAAASGGESEPNVDPSDRIAVERLMRVAELRVADATGLDPTRGRALRVEVVNRTRWADRTVDDYGDLIQALGQSVASGGAPSDDDQDDDQMAALLSAAVRMLSPTLAAVTVGSMVGKLARRALGGYALPVPRPEEAPVLLVLPNVDAFGRQWSLDRDDLRLCVCLHEAVHHAVFGVAHVRGRLSGLLRRHAASFDTSPRQIQRLFEDIDVTGGPDQVFASMRAAMGTGGAMLGAAPSPAQRALQPELAALVAAVAGYADHVMDTIGAQLIGTYGQLSEALRRHRAEAAASDAGPPALLGLDLGKAQYDRGSAFASGVVERAGADGLRRLLSDPANLPTPAEVDAPGLWLARIDLSR